MESEIAYRIAVINVIGKRLSGANFGINRMERARSAEGHPAEMIRRCYILRFGPAQRISRDISRVGREIVRDEVLFHVPCKGECI